MNEQNREYKQKYSHRFRIVQRIINQWDPLGLLPDDVDLFDDEYEPEIAQIVALLGKNQRDVLATAEGILKVFSQWFGDNYAHYFPLEDCKRVATHIWQAIDGDTERD